MDKELMLKQIDATLKQEKKYLKDYNEQLRDPSIIGAARERILMFREAVLEAITRHEKYRLNFI
ncbi:hypothetical protein [Wukongibacter sp. M2B1]|uniref:hypothetical protein n=1 Tax=Wukongibacter sp. M2B1 TaxID=3088895 RepID=UPI003D7BADD5